jgi:hypothetical protein
MRLLAGLQARRLVVFSMGYLAILYVDCNQPRAQTESLKNARPWHSCTKITADRPSVLDQ